MQLAGRTAVVTGAGRNIGKAIAMEFARQGANVVVSDLPNSDSAELAAAEVRSSGGKTIAVTADVTQRGQVNHLIDAAQSAFGKIDILVHTPAIRPVTPFLEITDDEWDRVLTINLRSAVYISQAVLPGMLAHKYGRIILFSGMAIFAGEAERAHVMASKAGIVGLVRGLSMEFAPHGVTVNSISPGFMNTIRPTEWWPGKPGPGSSFDPGKISKDIPVGRIGEPFEIAATCVFLASSEAGYITGQTIHVNGGRYLG